MVFTGYFQTEQVPGEHNGWSKVLTSINQEVFESRKKGGLILGEYINYGTNAAALTIYMQNEASDLGGVYKILNTTEWNGPVVQYSGTDTAVPLYSCASAADIFTSAQDFSTHNVLWTITYNAKVSGTPAGETPYIAFKFYKRDAGGAETLLFTKEVNVGAFYSFDGYESSGFFPSGSVADTDRLVIKVYHGSRLPA